MLPDVGYFNNVVGTDPVSKGSFIIDYGYVKSYWDYDDDYTEYTCQGQFIIPKIWKLEDNILFDIVCKTPLKLQTLVAKVDFEGENRFIQVTGIRQFEKSFDENSFNIVVDFIILDNMRYLEALQEYQNNWYEPK